MTTSVNIPTLTAGTFKPVRWQLASMLNPGSALVGNSVLEVEIEPFNANLYLLRRPKIVGLTAPLEVKGIHVMIKKASTPGPGSEDPLNDYWSTDDVQVQPSPLPGTLPTTPFNAPPMDARSEPISIVSAQDALSFGFDDLKPGVSIVPEHLSAEVPELPQPGQRAGRRRSFDLCGGFGKREHHDASLERGLHLGDERKSAHARRWYPARRG
jgi:hypothetical protein